MTWIQFKDYWKTKTHGGWLFDDATLGNDKNRMKFEQAWMIAGPIYCDKHGLEYATYSQAQMQKNRAAVPIHYIFALD